MSRTGEPPFERGDTFYNGGVIDATDNTTLGGVNLEGKEYYFEPNSAFAGATGVTTVEDTGRPIKVRCVRNVSGATLKGARIAHYAPTDPYGTRVDGYTFAVGDRPAGVIDEFLPAAGVPNNDLFWLIVDGPSKIKQPHTSNSNLAIGDAVVPTAGGAASLTDDLGGRILKQDLTGATATLGNNLQHRVGYVSTANNTVDALVNVVVSLASGS